jgi:hypothetical protein
VSPDRIRECHDRLRRHPEISKNYELMQDMKAMHGVDMGRGFFHECRKAFHDAYGQLYREWLADNPNDSALDFESFVFETIPSLERVVDTLRSL